MKMTCPSPIVLTHLRLRTFLLISLFSQRCPWCSFFNLVLLDWSAAEKASRKISSSRYSLLLETRVPGRRNNVPLHSQHPTLQCAYRQDMQMTFMALCNSPSHSVVPHSHFRKNKAREVKFIHCLLSSKHLYSHMYPYNSIPPTSSPLSILV